MEKEIDKKLEGAISSIRSITPEYSKLGLEMFKAHGGSMYLMDLYVNAAINRAEHLISAFCDLIEKRNFLVAAPVLRMQLDNLFRLRAAWLVSDINGFVSAVLNGTPIKNLKDKNGNRMSDRFLVENLCKERPELKSIYEHTCSYVHLSDQHFFAMIDDFTNEGKIRIHASESSGNVPLESYFEACSAFFQISGIMVSYIQGWILTKDKKV